MSLLVVVVVGNVVRGGSEGLTGSPASNLQPPAWSASGFWGAESERASGRTGDTFWVLTPPALPTLRAGLTEVGAA